eukprot:6300632-Alexandrium_andersonii.AAC.1
MSRYKALSHGSPIETKETRRTTAQRVCVADPWPRPETEVELEYRSMRRVGHLSSPSSPSPPMRLRKSLNTPQRTSSGMADMVAPESRAAGAIRSR